MSLTVVMVIALALCMGIRAATGSVAGPWLASGTTYLLLGIILGPSGIGLVTQEHLSFAQPLISMALGLLGFVLGLTLRKRLGRAAVMAETVLGSGLIMAVVAAGCLALLKFLFAPGPSDIALLATLAALAAVSGEPTIRATQKRLNAHGAGAVELGQRAYASTIAAVLLFGGALSYARGSHGLLTQTEWLVLAVVAGLACGALFALFTRGTTDRDRTVVGIIGVVTLASGLASGMGISPLFVSVVVGAVVGATSLTTLPISEPLARLREPTEIFILVPAGATFIQPGLWVLLIPVVWLVCRLAAWRLAPTIGRAVVEGHRGGPSVGPALSTFGPIGAAIALNHSQAFPQHSGIVIGATALAMLVSDIFGSRMVRKTLADLGELDPSFSEAL
ncbi:MAG: hypothetical protein ACI9OJ_004918 [Myxococcota bacterium]